MRAPSFDEHREKLLAKATYEGLFTHEKRFCRYVAVHNYKAESAPTVGNLIILGLLVPQF